MQKKTFAMNDDVIVVSDDTYNGRKGYISGIPYNDWDAYFVTLESGEIDLRFFWNELEPADAPAPEAGEPEALRVNPLTDAGALLSVNLKLNAEKEKRMDSEAGAYNLYTELCDVKEENRSHLRRLDTVTNELDTLRAELARVKAERDAARDAAKAWKAAAKTERDNAKLYKAERDEVDEGYTRLLTLAAQMSRERRAVRAFVEAYVSAAAAEWVRDYNNWMTVADFHLNEKNELRAALAETHEHYKDLALILRRNGIVPLNYEAMDARDIANEKLLKGDQS